MSTITEYPALKKRNRHTGLGTSPYSAMNIKSIEMRTEVRALLKTCCAPGTVLGALHDRNFSLQYYYHFFWNDNWKMTPVSPVIHVPYFSVVQVAQDHVLHCHIKSSILFISKATQPEWPHTLTSPRSPDKHLSLFFQAMVFTSFLLLTAPAVHHLPGLPKLQIEQTCIRNS